MKTLTILQLNDLHGYLEPHWEMVHETNEWSLKKLGGLARISSLFKNIRNESPGAILTVDNGDTFHGTYISTTQRGLSMIEIMNAMKFDAMTTHWEFAYGPSGVKEISKKLNYPMLGINCFYKDSNELFFQPYQMIERGGLKVALIGLACPIVDKTMPPSFSEGVYFTIGNEELPRWIETVKEKEKADVIVILSHLGFPQDIQLAKEVNGIDILVSGHTHNRMDHAVVINNAIIFQSGCHGSFIGKLVAQIQNKKVISFKHDLIPVDDHLDEDPVVKSLVNSTLDPHRKKLNEVVGEITMPLHRYSMLSTPMDDVLLEAIMSAASTQIAFSNGWRYGVPIPAGVVTIDNLWNIIPVNPPVQTVDMSGAELWQMLEDNLERTFAANPYEQMGGYVKRMRGITMYFKAENPNNCRIDRLFVGKKKIIQDEIYSVAFVTAQGVPMKFGKNRKKLDIDSITALQNLFKSKEKITPSQVQTVFEI
ncbi:MAG: 5'-nucleotidase C-terminal domain-containing protein [Bacteriovorax sp.]|nr:5'-nucleotidase C-terminal domain-containing protein [Bacteriovorax sp.]